MAVTVFVVRPNSLLAERVGCGLHECNRHGDPACRPHLRGNHKIGSSRCAPAEGNLTSRGNNGWIRLLMTGAEPAGGFADVSIRLITTTSKSDAAMFPKL